MQPIKIYADRRSQPSRAVIIFCRVNQIDFEEVKVDLFKAQHRTPEFRKVNPMGQVPAIVDGRFKLFESHAILRYLASVFPGVPDHWYPADLFTRAKIESILDWHHTNLRRGAATLIMHTVLAPFLGLTPSPEAAKQAQNLLVQSLERIESEWLKGDTKFLLGNPQPSIADLSLVCEIMQLEKVLFSTPEGFTKIPHRLPLQNKYQIQFIDLLFSQSSGTRMSLQCCLCAARRVASVHHLLSSNTLKFSCCSIILYEYASDLLARTSRIRTSKSLSSNTITKILGDDVRDRFLGAHEKILIWINNVKKATSPHFEEAHELLFEVKALMQSKAAAAASQPSTKLKTASKL